MSEQTTNTGAAGNPTPAAEEKTFTQNDVNRIVADRVMREKSKAEAELAEKEKDFAQRELDLLAKETLNSKGLPVALAGILRYTDAESLEANLKTLQEIYPQKAAEKFLGVPIGTKLVQPDRVNYGSAAGGVRAAMGLKG